MERCRRGVLQRHSGSDWLGMGGTRPAIPYSMRLSILEAFMPRDRQIRNGPIDHAPYQPSVLRLIARCYPQISACT